MLRAFQRFIIVVVAIIAALISASLAIAALGAWTEPSATSATWVFAFLLSWVACVPAAGAWRLANLEKDYRPGLDELPFAVPVRAAPTPRGSAPVLITAEGRCRHCGSSDIEVNAKALGT